MDVLDRFYGYRKKRAFLEVEQIVRTNIIGCCDIAADITVFKVIPDWTPMVECAPNGSMYFERVWSLSNVAELCVSICSRNALTNGLSKRRPESSFCKQGSSHGLEFAQHDWPTWDVRGHFCKIGPSELSLKGLGGRCLKVSLSDQTSTACATPKKPAEILFDITQDKKTDFSP